MEFIPVKTRIMQPPQDDLLAVLDEYLIDVQEGDVVVIASKVVAIHEGRCVPNDDFKKDAYIAETADVIIPRSYWPSPLTITNHLLVTSAGVDQSSGNGHRILLPEDPFASAKYLHKYLVDRFSLKEVGVIITDSHSQPLRYGACNGAISFWGIDPLHHHAGKKDLFGRVFHIERTNMVDSIATAAGIVMGETNERHPVVIARNIPGVTFAEGNQRENLFAPFKDDIFRILYQQFIDEQ